ncbi:YheC/YheD family protein [Calidifontibacillus oryziterrae]|uniref:YheC/YheD family protein n=1 Tax=Calidifontibacillus oryziterrae TaxID=1191699 RepID=UPI0002D77C16|nr:YheC/YheD family protein [Calidifontibacillus oryziterrae]
MHNWVDIYDTLQTDEQFTQNLVPSIRIQTSGQFLRLLNDYRRIILKPNERVKHGDTFVIESKGNSNFIYQAQKISELDQEQLRALVKHKITDKPHFIQPYIICKTRLGNRYSLKLHVNKHGNQKWQLTAIYPQIARLGSMITNPNYGGFTQKIELFLPQQFGEQADNIKHDLVQFAPRFASALGKISSGDSNMDIHEIVINVVLDDLHNIWVFDVKNEVVDYE